MQIANGTSPPPSNPSSAPVGQAPWPWRAMAMVQGWSQLIGEEQSLWVAKKCGWAMGKGMGLESESGVRWKS